MNGGCVCGNIRFSATGEPDFPHLCSCPHCQRLSGAPVMAWPTETHPAIERGFCPACGASVASRGDVPGNVGVTIFALDDHSELVPEHQSFKDNAVPWMAPLG